MPGIFVPGRGPAHCGDLNDELEKWFVGSKSHKESSAYNDAFFAYLLVNALHRSLFFIQRNRKG
jgi:hypothetical protein